MRIVSKGSMAWAGPVVALAFAFASVTWAAPAASSSSDPTPYATPSVNAPIDTTQPTVQQSSPCPVSDTAGKADKKDKHDKHDKDKKDESIDAVEPGTTPVGCDTPGGKDFDPDKVVGVGSDMIKIKPGSIEDVNAVGNRNIGGRGLGNWYSIDSEIKMGKQYADQVDKSARFITDPVVDEYVNRIGQNIVKNSDCKVPFTIKVIDSDEINAFALPGGFFYVNSGLILAADEEAELAGVMAHETAHVCAHHAAREMTRLNYAQLGMVPLMIFTGYTWTGYGIYEAAQLAIPITFLKFSRDFEAQADYLGIQYMYRAGYDPQGMINFFEKIEALEKRKPGMVAKAFADHPQTPDRILHSQEEIARILPARDEYLVTTSEFNSVKARLARIENKRRLTTKDLNKPSLRRANTKPGDTTGSGTDTTDQPTLHRRDDNGNGGQN
jgi:Peptidase family M48